MIRRIIVAGSRNYTNWPVFRQIMDELFLSDKENIEIISGEARGPDRMAMHWAEQNEVALARFPADWDRFGKSAGYRRNVEMAEYAAELGRIGELVIFWDGVSKGTRHMHDIAIKYGLKVRIFMVDTDDEPAKVNGLNKDEYDVLISRLEQRWVQEKKHHEQT